MAFIAASAVCFGFSLDGPYGRLKKPKKKGPYLAGESGRRRQALLFRGKCEGALAGSVARLALWGREKTAFGVAVAIHGTWAFILGCFCSLPKSKRAAVILNRTALAYLGGHIEDRGAGCRCSKRSKA